MRRLTPLLRHSWIVVSMLASAAFLTSRMLGHDGQVARREHDTRRFFGENVEIALVLLALVAVLWLLYRLLLSPWRSATAATAATGVKPIGTAGDRWHNPRPGHQHQPGSVPRPRPFADYDAAGIATASASGPNAGGSGAASRGAGVGRAGVDGAGVGNAEDLGPVAGTDAGPAQRSTEEVALAADQDSEREAYQQTRFPPVLQFLHVDRPVVGKGLPLEVTWSFEDADSVTVDGMDGYPATGSVQVLLPHSRFVEVTAFNSHGRTTARTRLVMVLPLPSIETLTLPAPPSIRLHVDVSGTIDVGRTAAAHLDRLFQGQDALRPAASDALSPLGVPRNLVHWLRQRDRTKSDELTRSTNFTDDQTAGHFGLAKKAANP